MKKVWVFTLAATLAISMLAGCKTQKQAEEKKETTAQEQTAKESTVQTENEAQTEPKEKEEAAGKVIAVIPKSLLFDYWQYVRIGAQSAGLDEGYTIDFQGTRTDTDLEGQVKLVEDFIQRGVSAIVISPVNPDGMVPVLQQAEEAGIPVIIMDGKLNADFPRSTVSTNDEAAGKFAAEKLKELAGDAGGTFAIVSAVPGAVQEGGREKGFSDELETYQNYKIIGTYYGKGDRNQTYNITQDILTSNPDITGFYTVNEGSSAGVTLGVREGDLKDKIFVAFDPSTEVLDAIRDGYVDGAVAQNPYLIGRTAVLNVIKVLNGETVEKKIDVPVTWVTIDNLDDPEIQNVLKPEEVIK
ncbi:MAG: substrate-binding domain-containing protein [Clostridia bacterium]|nr:substrate-binding domain-containing protein [Clostridia bacterium]